MKQFWMWRILINVVNISYFTQYYICSMTDFVNSRFVHVYNKQNQTDSDEGHAKSWRMRLENKFI
jgi:hypothetical protein